MIPEQYKLEVDTRWLSGIMQAMYDMRKAQKEYFQQPSNYRLKNSKAKECAADAIIEQAIKNGYVKTEQPTANQPQLFP